MVTDAAELEACLITKGATIEACLVTEGAALEACLVNEGIAVNDNTSVMERSGTESENNSSETPFSRSEDENRSSDKEINSSKGNDAAADIGPSYDSDIVTENMDPDRDKEKHDDVDYEQKHKTFTKENGKFDEYVQPLLNRINELEKKNQEFLKNINDLDNKLRKAGQTNQTLRMLLPKEDNVNTGKQGLGFENQNKAKELAPYLYNIDEIGKDELYNHKIISEEELKCEAGKHLKVKQRKSPLSYHGFVYAETQFEEPPKVPLKRRYVKLLSKTLEKSSNEIFLLCQTCNAQI
ncbi:hypothetical protein Tco_0226183 [Tanacetum coccineum]